MSRLVIDTYHVTLVDENGRRLELVPGKTYQFSTPTSLVTRLQSTRSGNNAWWSCGEKARTALNKSPYQPVIRAIVQCFRWMPPGTKDNRRLFDYDYDFDSLDEVTHGGYVVQGGTGVLNWFTVVVEPVPDPLSGVFDAVRGGSSKARHGHSRRRGAATCTSHLINTRTSGLSCLVVTSFSCFAIRYRDRNAAWTSTPALTRKCSPH